LGKRRLKAAVRAKGERSLPDDLVVALQGLGKPQQTVAVEIALTGVPEHPILQDCHLAKER